MMHVLAMLPCPVPQVSRLLRLGAETAPRDATGPHSNELTAGSDEAAVGAGESAAGSAGQVSGEQAGDPASLSIPDGQQDLSSTLSSPSLSPGRHRPKHVSVVSHRALMLSQLCCVHQAGRPSVISATCGVLACWAMYKHWCSARSIE